MSQRVVEATLGRLLCDDAFRREFDRDFEGTLHRYGLDLTSSEAECLRALRIETIDVAAQRLDDRIRRADLEHLTAATAREDRMTLLLRLMESATGRGH